MDLLQLYKSKVNHTNSEISSFSLKINIRSEDCWHASHAVGTAVVHPELLGRDAECYQVKQGSNPAVQGILLIAFVHIRPELVHIRVLLRQGNILDQGHTVDVEEDPHEGELHDPPGREHNSAQRQLWTTEGHFLL